jgi:hypothetical protein
MLAWRWRWHNEFGDGKPDFACMVGLKDELSKHLHKEFGTWIYKMPLWSPLEHCELICPYTLFSTSSRFMKNKGMGYKKKEFNLLIRSN